MIQKSRQSLAFGLLFLWGWVLIVACRETAVTATPPPVVPNETLTSGETAVTALPPATLTRQAMQYILETSLAEHPRVQAASEMSPSMLTSNGKNKALVMEEGQTRRARNVTAMLTQVAQWTPTPEFSDILLQSGDAPQIDGVIADKEWADGAKRTIPLADQKSIDVWLKLGQNNLYVSFVGLNQGESQLFPELLLDGLNDKNNQMDDNDWWFQAAPITCWGSGQDAIWQQCGTPKGWRVSPWTTDANVVEMAIPYETIGLLPGDTQPVGIAFALLSVTADGQEQRVFWPNTAKLNAPQTWGTAQAADGW